MEINFSSLFVTNTQVVGKNPPLSTLWPSSISGYAQVGYNTWKNKAPFVVVLALDFFAVAYFDVNCQISCSFHC